MEEPSSQPVKRPPHRDKNRPGRKVATSGDQSVNQSTSSPVPQKRAAPPVSPGEGGAAIKKKKKSKKKAPGGPPKPPPKPECDRSRNIKTGFAPSMPNKREEEKEELVFTAEEESEPKSELFSEKPFPSNLHTFAAIQTMGFKHMTTVQEEVLDPLLSGQDLIVAAKTGSGKSLAYLVPALERLYKTLHSRSIGNPVLLVLVPIRELTLQIEQDIMALTKHWTKKVTCLRIIGGRSTQLRPCDVLIATPGRLAADIRLEKVQPDYWSKVSIAIYDEADAFMDSGFIKEWRRINQQVPVSAQRCYFSATFPEHVLAEIPNYKNLKRISTIVKEENVTVSTSTLHLIVTPDDQYEAAAVSILKQYRQSKKIMVFVPTVNAVKLYQLLFKRCEIYDTFTMSGRTSQTQREKNFEQFKSGGDSSLLITSDVSARGVDMDNVDLVIMLGAPQSSEIFVHRSGRTARAGKSGDVVLLMQESHKPDEYVEILRAKKIEFDTVNEFPFKLENEKVVEKAIPNVPTEMIQSALRSLIAQMLSSKRWLSIDEIIAWGRKKARDVYHLQTLNYEKRGRLAVSKVEYARLSAPIGDDDDK